MIVARGDHRRRAAGAVTVDPRGGDAVQVLPESAGDDPAVRLVGVEAARVTGAQHQRRGRFPRLAEAVDLLQLLDPPGGAQLVEQAAPADGLQLTGIADEGEPPTLPLSEHDELVQRRCADHAGLVDDHRRPSRQPPPVAWWTIGAVPLVEQFGHGVGGDAGVVFEDTGGLGGRRQPEQRPPLAVQVVDGGSQHAGLAGTGRTDHQHQPRRRRRQRPPPLACNTSSPHGVHGGRRCRRVQLRVDRPGDDVFLLGQHRLGREARGGRFDPHRSSIRCPPRRSVGRVEVDQILDHPVGGSFDGVEPTASRHLRHRTLHVTDRLDHIGATPRRALRRHHLDDVVDRCRIGGRPVAGCVVRCRRRACRRSSQPRRPRSATVSSDRRHRDRTCRLRVSADASRLNAARSHRDGSRP